MEYLYLDESGQFEGDRAKPLTTFVGGLLTTAQPPAVAKVFKKLFKAVTAHPELKGRLAELTEPSAMHMLELYDRLSDAELDTFRHLALRHLRDLPGLRLVSTHYFADAHSAFDAARDDHGAHRFLRMWQATVRNVLYYQTEPGESSLAVYTAQRSVPLGVLEAKERFYMQSFEAIPIGDQEGFKVVSSEQVPRLLLGVLSRGSSAPFRRTFESAEVGGPLTRVTGKQIQRRPFLAGLLLADIACDLIGQRESGAETDLALSVQKSSSIRVAYHPAWERYERLCEAALDSQVAVQELLSAALGQGASRSQAEAWISSAADRLLRSLLNRAEPKTDLRSHFLAVARSELSKKEGSFPRCDRILGEHGLRKPPSVDEGSFDEWILRVAYMNHTGREPADERARLESSLQAVLAKDVGAFLQRGEDLAHLAVSHQDEFDYDTAADLVEDYLQRARPVFDLLAKNRDGAHWTGFGRVLSNLAQTYAYRQEEGDLGRARGLMVQAKPHMKTGLDQSQWGCHAGNLAGLLGDEDLLSEALDVLFATTNVDQILEKLTSICFGPDSRTEPLFSFSVVSRLGVVGKGSLAARLRARLSEPETWRLLFNNVRAAVGAHPLELYARHLLELAPESCWAEEDAVLALSVRGFGNQLESRVANTLEAGTRAAYALKLFRRGEAKPAKEQASLALSAFSKSFSDNPYVSTTTYYADMETGWFYQAVQGLRSDVTETALISFLERFRYEWR